MVAEWIVYLLTPDQILINASSGMRPAVMLAIKSSEGVAPEVNLSLKPRTDVNYVALFMTYINSYRNQFLLVILKIRHLTKSQQLVTLYLLNLGTCEQTKVLLLRANTENS